MTELLTTLLPPCPTIPIDGCLLTFLEVLPNTEKEELFRKGVGKLIEALNKEISKVERLSLNLQSGITALNTKIASLTAELKPYDDALQVIDDFLSETACPQLDLFRTILQTLRSFIAAAIAAINVSGLQSLLDAANANIDTLTCYVDLAQSLLDAIPKT